MQPTWSPRSWNTPSSIERAYLSAEQLATVERFYPEINNWLLGYDLDKALPSFEQGLTDLRATCPNDE